MGTNLYDVQNSFGYKVKAPFYAGYSASTLAFKQTDIMTYLDGTSTAEYTDTSIGGYYTSYPHSTSQTSTVNEPDPYAAFSSPVNKITSPYAQTLPTKYLRSAGLLIREVLYFQSAVPLTSASTTVTFKTGDLDSIYKV